MVNISGANEDNVVGDPVQRAVDQWNGGSLRLGRVGNYLFLLKVISKNSTEKKLSL